MPKPQDDTYTPEEAQARFEAALRGARVAGHKTMKDVAGKGRSQRALTKRRRAGSPSCNANQVPGTLAPIVWGARWVDRV